jgi:hypothetical protein
MKVEPSRLALDGKASPVGLGDLARYREAEPRAARVSSAL